MQRRHDAASELGAEPNALAMFLTLGETRVTLRVCEDNSDTAIGVVLIVGGGGGRGCASDRSMDWLMVATAADSCETVAAI